MNIFKRVIAILLVILLFLGSCVGSYTFFNKGTYEFDAKYLSLFDEQPDSYYLQKAPHDIKFCVEVSSGSLSYVVSDLEGNTVPIRSERVSENSYNILPPDGGYDPGEQYTLVLGESVSFVDENLKNARTLVFCIEREEVERYMFTNHVIETKTTIDELSENTISLNGIEAQPGEILFGTNSNNENVVYKITEVMDNGTAAVTIPAIEEIYAELDVYGEYEFDVNQLVSNPDLEVEITENVKQSTFYSTLIMTAYAADTRHDGEIEVSIVPDIKTGSIQIEIKITLEPGENGLFGMSKLREHKVSIVLQSTVSTKLRANIQGIKKWDVSGTVTSDFSWQVEIERILVSEKCEPGLEELFADKNEYDSYDDYYVNKQYQKDIKKITEALNQIAADASGGEIKLFDWKLPVPSVPGLYFSAEVKLFARLEMTAGVVVGQQNSAVYTVGVCFANNDFRPYFNTHRSGEDVTLSLRGKLEAKTGIKLVIRATLINDKVANIDVDPQVGLYLDIYATVPILGAEQATADRLMYSYFEPGIYFSASINANLNILVKKYKFSHELIEKKFPIDKWTLGNSKIAMGIVANATSVRAEDNVARLPEFLFKFYDVKSGINKSEKIPFEDLKFVTNEGLRLQEDDGKLTLPAATSSGSCYVTATYIHSDGKTYSTVFRVLVSGSILEGRVSTYSEDLSTGALEGAQVALYTSTNNESPISTQTTDENGKFAFNVSEGDYRLVVSADGYRTLTSNQHVKKDEIKYTEHILLMDDSQSGMGTAGGMVANALDGAGVEGVQLRLRNDWNNTSGPYVEGFETTTNTSGKYSVTDVPVGYYTVEASASGYVTGYTNIIVLSEDGKTNFDFTITPELNDNEIRVVLTWGDSPADLDAHLIGRTPSDDTFNVYFSDMDYYYEGVEMANLDVDDRSCYGPETITIFENIYGLYTYMVHNYSNKDSSNSDALSFSGAVVRIFKGSNQVAEYHVPTDQVGTYWTVFQIDSAGRIVPINTISNTKPAT